MRRGSAPLCSSLALVLAAGTPGLAQEDDPFDTLFGEEQDPAGEDTDAPRAPVERARSLLAGGRHDEAEAILRDAREEAPGDALVLRTLARLYLKCGRDDAAAEQAARLLEVQPDQPQGHLLKGILAESRGELDAAESAYRDAWALARDFRSEARLEVLVRLGRLLAETEQREEAGDELERVLQLYQRQSELTAAEFTWVAKACLQLDYFPEVKESYRRSMVEYARRMLDQALLADGSHVPAHVFAGRLSLLKLDTPQAKSSLEEAVTIDPNHPDARVALAEAHLAAFYAGNSRYEDAAENLRVALAVDPEHPGAHALLARMSVTDGEPEEALERLDNALESHPAHVGLLAVKAAVHLLRAEPERFAAVEERVLADRPKCGRFYEEVATLLEKKFRYAEARDMARKALDANPGYHPPLAILGVNLTRTGEEEEGVRVLKQAFEQDPYNVYVYNQLELFERLDEHYETIETDHFTIRMHKEEAKASARYVVDLLQEARAKLAPKYGAMPERVLVELFPEHDDFSARSVGLPGIPALGVCFGNVVTVLSAAEKDAGTHSWGRTLWHEFTHVATLTRTKNRIPRWFTEGISVYEEPRGRPSWQREYHAQMMTLMARDLLLPIADLDAGFTKPEYPGQVLMSYYQGGATCDFIDDRWGFAKIDALLGCFRKGLDTAAAIEAVFAMSPEAFDERFRAWLEDRYADYAFLPPPSVEERQALLDRVSRDPWDMAARGALARAYALHGKPADAETHAGLALDHAEAAVVPWSLTSDAEAQLGHAGAARLAAVRAAAVRAGAADAWLARGIVAARRGEGEKALERLRRALELGTRDPVTAHQRIGAILRAQGDVEGALEEYLRVAELAPPTADVHRVLHACYSSLDRPEEAMGQLEEVCRLDSEDTKSRLAYARWAKRTERWGEVVEVLNDINLIDPFIPAAHVLLAEGLRRTADGDAEALERSVTEYQAAIDLEVDYQAGCYYGQAWCLNELGRAEEAREKLRLALGDDPDHEGARRLKEELGTE